MNRLQRSWEVLRCELWRANVISPSKSLGELKVLLCSFTFRTMTESCIGHMCHNPLCNSASFPGIIDTDIIKPCLYWAMRLCYCTKGCWSPCASSPGLWPAAWWLLLWAICETRQACLMLRNPSFCASSSAEAILRCLMQTASKIAVSCKFLFWMTLQFQPLFPHCSSLGWAYGHV